MNRWQLAKMQSDLENLLKSNPAAFDDEEDEEEVACATYREQYIDPNEPTVIKINYTKPTSWQVFCNYVCSFFR